MTTKYIVNNASGQTISEINSTTIISDTISATTYSNLPIPSYISSGPSAPGSAVVANDTDVDINFSDGVGTAWSFSTTGMTFPDDTVQTTAYEPKYKVYTALLTQSGGDEFLSLGVGDNLQIGVTYQILDDGGNGWDFTNVGAPNNNLNTHFVATGTTPNSWGTGVFLEYNTGAPVVTVLENTIGNIWFTYSQAGIYFGHSSNLFTQNKTLILLGTLTNNSYDKTFVTNTSLTDSIFELVVQETSWTGVDGELNNTPIEIRVYN
jgi:hypothetical protein